MGSRRTQNAEVAQFNPWIMQCIQPPRPNSKQKAVLWRDGPQEFISPSTLSTVGIDKDTPIRIIGSTESPSDGIVLAACGLVIRVAIPGCDDATEFSCRGGKWISEDSESVEIHSFATKSHLDHALTRACFQSGAVETSSVSRA